MLKTLLEFWPFGPKPREPDPETLRTRSNGRIQMPVTPPSLGLCRVWRRKRRRLGAALLAVAIAAQGLPRARADEAARGLERYNAPIQAAVDRALAYLARNQLPDGSFPAPMPHNTAIASLCAMAFLVRGHVPDRGPYGTVLHKVIDFVLRTRTKEGLLVNGNHRSHGPMYSHSISTLMLSEVSGMATPEQQARLEPVLGRALQILLAAQAISKDSRYQGGWRYQPTSRDSDISCTGWALMALRSARNNGAHVPIQAARRAVAFVLRCRNPDGGFAYQPGGGSGVARTGTALLCLELSGRHGTDECRRAGEYILEHIPLNPDDRFFYYAQYYCSQAMFQLGGKYWEQFAAALFQQALGRQNADGSWPPGHSTENQAGPCYSTAMTILAIGVVYRQLPIYQR